MSQITSKTEAMESEHDVQPAPEWHCASPHCILTFPTEDAADQHFHQTHGARIAEVEINNYRVSIPRARTKQGLVFICPVSLCVFVTKDCIAMRSHAIDQHSEDEETWLSTLPCPTPGVIGNAVKRFSVLLPKQPGAVAVRPESQIEGLAPKQTSIPAKLHHSEFPVGLILDDHDHTARQLHQSEDIAAPPATLKGQYAAPVNQLTVSPPEANTARNLVMEQRHSATNSTTPHKLPASLPHNFAATARPIILYGDRTLPPSEKVYHPYRPSYIKPANTAGSFRQPPQTILFDNYQDNNAVAMSLHHPHATSPLPSLSALPTYEDSSEAFREATHYSTNSPSVSSNVSASTDSPMPPPVPTALVNTFSSANPRKRRRFQVTSPVEARIEEVKRQVRRKVDEEGEKMVLGGLSEEEYVAAQGRVDRAVMAGVHVVRALRHVQGL